MAEIELVVFDMAGTTVDEQNVVYKTLYLAISRAGIPVSFEEVLRTGAGKEKRQAIIDLLADPQAQPGKVDDPQAPPALVGDLQARPGLADDQKTRSGLLADPQARSGLVDDIYVNFMNMLTAAYTALEVVPVPGAEKLFRALHRRGIHVALNTGYSRDTAEQLLTKLGWRQGREYDTLVTATDVQRGRPHPDMIHMAMDRLGITDPRRVAKVGDSTVDIQEGRNARCGQVIGITTGAHTHPQLQSAQPDAIVDSLGEVLDVLG